MDATLKTLKSKILSTQTYETSKIYRRKKKSFSEWIMHPPQDSNAFSFFFSVSFQFFHLRFSWCIEFFFCLRFSLHFPYFLQICCIFELFLFLFHFFLSSVSLFYFYFLFVFRSSFLGCSFSISSSSFFFIGSLLHWLLPWSSSV